MSDANDIPKTAHGWPVITKDDLNEEIQNITEMIAPVLAQAPKETDCEAREFWLQLGTPDFICTEQSEVAGVLATRHRENLPIIHVISFSAFEKLREENEALRAALQQCHDLQDTDYITTTDESGDEKELWISSSEIRAICDEALQKGPSNGK